MERMKRLFDRARELDVIDSGSQLVFTDFLKDCQNEIRKQEQQVQRCVGRIDQLKLMEAMVTQVVNKYCTMQENANREMEEAKERRPKVTKKKTTRKKK